MCTRAGGDPCCGSRTDRSVCPTLRPSGYPIASRPPEPAQSETLKPHLPQAADATAHDYPNGCGVRTDAADQPPLTGGASVRRARDQRGVRDVVMPAQLGLKCTNESPTNRIPERRSLREGCGSSRMKEGNCHVSSNSAGSAPRSDGAPKTARIPGQATSVHAVDRGDPVPTEQRRAWDSNPTQPTLWD